MTKKALCLEDNAGGLFIYESGHLYSVDENNGCGNDDMVCAQDWADPFDALDLTSEQVQEALDDMDIIATYSDGDLEIVSVDQMGYAGAQYFGLEKE